MLARLAWNNWPDTEGSRREVAAHEARDPISAAAWDRVIVALQAEHIDYRPPSENDVAILKAQHADLVQTKRRTGERLKSALDGLQKVHDLAKEAFEQATHDRPRVNQK